MIRAKVNQIRPTSQREDPNAALEGTAIHKTPVSLEALMNSFQGRYFMDVTADVPSETLQMGDLTASTPLVEPSRPQGNDTWTTRREGDKRFLVRLHELPRLALFNPTRATNCPVALEELIGTRRTVIRPVHGGDEVTINDTVEETRPLQLSGVEEPGSF